MLKQSTIAAHAAVPAFVPKPFSQKGKQNLEPTTNSNNLLGGGVAKAIKMALFVVFVIGQSAQDAFSQVRTTILNGGSLEHYVPFYDVAQIPESMVMPEVDIEAAIAEHAARGRESRLFGVKIPTEINERDGDFETMGSTTIWRLSIKSYEATSLNFQLSGLALPSESEMYLYNRKGTMFSGPILDKYVFQGRFSTEIIKGEEVILQVVFPTISLEQFKLKVHHVIHGFDKSIVGEREFNDSGTCNIDVNCSSGPAVSAVVRDAVMKIYSGASENCSGVLINNTCQDLRSLVLTANHCLDGCENDWNFRFNYDSPDPIAPSCRGSESTTFFTYNGSSVLASNSTSDFAILEMFNSVVNQPTLGLAGWDQRAALPTTTIGVHHADGDVKKKCLDTGAPIVTGNGGVAGATDHLTVTWNAGITAQVSSGSPLLDGTAQRVIGQLHGGTSFCSTPAAPDFYGRLFTSWGLGLSSVLAPLPSPPTTMNPIRPITLPISGPSIVCSTSPTNSSHTLPGGLSSGQGITWSISPSSLFATGSGATVTGTGPVATVRPKINVKGFAILTFTMNAGTGCIVRTFTKNIWVGKPLLTVSVSSFNYCIGNFGTAEIPNAYAQGLGNIQWTRSGPISAWNSQGGLASFIAGPGTGSASISASASNVCGSDASTPTGFGVVSCMQQGGEDLAIQTVNEENILVQASPNPAKNNLHISLSMSDAVAAKSSNGAVFTIYDAYGRMIKMVNSPSTFCTINVQTYISGVYRICVMFNGKNFHKQFVVNP